MGAGAAEINARHRCASRQPSIPHVLRQNPALEAVPAGEPHALLDVGRSEHLQIDDRLWKVRAETSHRPHYGPTNLVAAGIPGSLTEAIGHVLREHAQRVDPRRGD